MNQFTAALLAFGASAMVAADQTTSIFLPIADPQPLVGSVIAQTNGNIKTVVIACPGGSNANSNCGFPTPLTITAGPSTIHLSTKFAETLTVDFQCHLEGTTTATCTEVYTGAASLVTSLTGDNIDPSSITTWTSTTTLRSADIVFLPVTITAGATSTMTSSSSNFKGSTSTASSSHGTSGVSSHHSTNSTSMTGAAAAVPTVLAPAVVAAGMLAALI